MKLLLPLLFILNVNCFPKTIIYGKIANTTFTSLKVSYLSNIIEEDNYTDFTTTVDKKGNFKIAIEINKIQSVLLNIGDKYLPLFVEPNDSLSVFTDNKDFYNTLRFSGKGSGNNNLRHQKFKEFGHLFYSGIDRDLVKTKAAMLNAKDFKLFTDSLTNYYNTYLENNKKDLSPEFYKYTKTSLYYMILNTKMDYANNQLSSKYKKGDKWDYSPYFEYYRFLDSISISNDSLLQNQYYRDFIQRYLFIKRSFTVNSLHNSNLEKNSQYNSCLLLYTLARILFTDKTREYMMALMVHDGFYYEQKKSSDKLYTIANEEIRDISYLKIIEKAYQKNKNKRDEMQIGEPFQDFSFKDINGNTITLDSLKGKIVFVDFWGSWCKGCMAEMPQVKEIKEKLKHKKNQIVYLYFNCFDKESKWKETVEKKQIEGLHIYLSTKDKIDFFAVNGFPTYFLLDRNGKIIKTARGELSDDFSVQEILKAIEAQ